MTKIQTLADFQSFASRLRAVRQASYQRAKAEAERVVGMPFHGCAWHNASLAYESGRPWPEFGRAAFRAYRRMQWQDRTISERCDRIERSAYDKFILRERARFQAAR